MIISALFSSDSTRDNAVDTVILIDLSVYSQPDIVAKFNQMIIPQEQIRCVAWHSYCVTQLLRYWLSSASREWYGKRILAGSPCVALDFLPVLTQIYGWVDSTRSDAAPFQNGSARFILKVRQVLGYFKVDSVSWISLFPVLRTIGSLEWFDFSFVLPSWGTSEYAAAG